MKGPNADVEAATRARDYLRSILPKAPFSRSKGPTAWSFVTFDVDGELPMHMIRMGHGYAYHGGAKRL